MYRVLGVGLGLVGVKKAEPIIYLLLSNTNKIIVTLKLRKRIGIPGRNIGYNSGSHGA